MPLVHLTYPEGALTPTARDEAVEKLTEALIRHEGAQDNAMTRMMSRCCVHELPPEAITVGGRPYEKPTYQVVMTVPEGVAVCGIGPAPTAARRALVGEATQIILEAEGTDCSHADAGRVFCWVEEIRDGYWGGMGMIFRLEDIVAMAVPELPQTEVSTEARSALAEFATQTDSREFA
jgi:phenylpyruvate tautomerase PptA (4-oxalocrotonate tautomerase family)